MVVCIQYLYIQTCSFLPHVIKRSLLYLGPQTVHVLTVFCETFWSAYFEAGISLHRIYFNTFFLSSMVHNRSLQRIFIYRQLFTSCYKTFATSSKQNRFAYLEISPVTCYRQFQVVMYIFFLT